MHAYKIICICGTSYSSQSMHHSPLGLFYPPAMSLSSFDFGAGFDDFSIELFDNFGADFESRPWNLILALGLRSASVISKDRSPSSSVMYFPFLIWLAMVVVLIGEGVFGVPTLSCVLRV